MFLRGLLILLPTLDFSFEYGNDADLVAALFIEGEGFPKRDFALGENLVGFGWPRISPVVA